MSSSAAQSPGEGPAGPAGQEHRYVQTETPENTTGQAEPVEVDDNEDGDESSYESGPGSETTSITDSVFEFTYANGRRYQSERFKRTGYFMPNDEGEQDRLDLYHHQFLLLLGGKLYLAPLENPQRVLDVGTGTGIWAMDFADLHPEAHVTGTDISPIQPSWVPPNASFEIDDMELPWTFQDDHFDFIHMRSLSGSFSEWEAVLAQAYQKMTPGGYLEFQDYGCEVFLSDGTKLEGINSEHPISTYMFQITSAAARAGRPLLVAQIMARLMEGAGFTDIQQHTVIWPSGPWPKQKELKELGRWGKLGMLETLYPFALHLLTQEGWAQAQVKELTDSVFASMKKCNYYFQGWFVYGRKPTV